MDKIPSMNKVCATCPWLKNNHGKKHPAKWYSLTNLRRLWNGLRTGKAPGMVCHSSDPDNREYGGDLNVKADNERRECAGAIILVIKHVNEANDTSWEKYHTKWGRFGLTLAGLQFWVSRFLSGTLPVVENLSNEVATADEKR